MVDSVESRKIQNIEWKTHLNARTSNTERLGPQIVKAQQL